MTNDTTSQASLPLCTHTLPVSGALRPYVSALMSAELSIGGPLPLAIVPHESLVLSVQLGRGPDAIEQKGAHGENTHLTGIRKRTGEFSGQGNCVTLFALLTPLGAVQLLDARPLAAAPRIRARMAELLDNHLTRDLESDVARAGTLDKKLLAFAAWLEVRATAHRHVGDAALRAGRAAMRLVGDPRVAMETLAGEQHVSRRQLERDFRQWLGTSPRHLAQVACVQAVSRKAQTGATLADIAADVGFADQAHMSRVVRQLTGLTPGRLTRSRPSPLAAGFRRATGGGTVYL
ncbi:AraC family transcriptional regulator [Aquincola tertiaricarbonis]|uniref:AraC family transcriptional regulator n=1 Tax=Aquincola tertiaricarbonis TaxID=391953 RepID=UPI00069893B4|nr:helix-turn-helix domain-containing protein [Aquincola tertiaricarbonis]